MSTSKTDIVQLGDVSFPTSEDDNCALIPTSAFQQSEEFTDWLNETGLTFFGSDCLDDTIINHKQDVILNDLSVRVSPELLHLSDCETDTLGFTINPSASNSDVSACTKQNQAQPASSKTDKNMNSLSKENTPNNSSFTKTELTKCEILEDGIKTNFNLQFSNFNVRFRDANGQDVIPNHFISQRDKKPTRNTLVVKPITEVKRAAIDSTIDMQIPCVFAEDLRVWLCPRKECYRAFCNFPTARTHALVHLNSKPYKCDFPNCTWAFYTSFKLRRHQETHTKRKDFICPVPECARRFTTVYNLKCHRRRHEKPANLPCTVKGCDQRFQTVRARELHLKTHGESEAPHRCPISFCNKAFFLHTALSSHMKVHSHKESELRCQWPNCGRLFEQPCRLKEHVRQHTGQRPYCCTYEDCKWSFPTASKLRRHLSTHTNERKFHCTIGTCNKSFMRSEHLRDHTLTHIGQQRNFHCDKCNSSFSGKSGLYLHVKKSHPEQNQACARAMPYSQPSPEKLSSEALLEQAVQSLGAPSDLMLGTGLLPDEHLEFLENENFSTVNLRDLD